MPVTPISFTLVEKTFVSGFGEWTYSITEETAKRCWQVLCNRQPTYDEVDGVLADLPVARGDPFKTGDGRYCQKITIKALANDPTSLYAEAEFSNAGTIEQNPLLRKDTISLEVAGETESWFVDSEGNPTVTSAGEILDKVPPRTTGGAKIVIEGNRSTLPASDLITKMRPSNTNSADMTIRGITFLAGQLKLIGCSASEQTENGVTFFRIRWELALAPTWDMTFDDRGFKYKDASDGNKIKPILVGEPPEPTTKPWPLNGSGGKKPNASDVPATITRKPYTASNLSVFSWTAA